MEFDFDSYESNADPVIYLRYSALQHNRCWGYQQATRVGNPTLLALFEQVHALVQRPRSLPKYFDKVHKNGA